MLQTKEQHEAELDKIRAELNQLRTAEDVMYERLEAEMKKFTGTKASADFMKFLKGAGPKATMQIQSARLKRDSKLKRVKDRVISAKKAQERLKKEWDDVNRDLRGAEKELKVRHSELLRTSHVVSNS